MNTPTYAFDFTDIVARKPPNPAIESSLPPATFLLTRHADDVTLGKCELILICLLEVEACLHQELLSSVFWHILRSEGACKHESKKTNKQKKLDALRTSKQSLMNEPERWFTLFLGNSHQLVAFAHVSSGCDWLTEGIYAINWLYLARLIKISFGNA